MLTKTTSVFLLTLYSLATINGQMLNEDEIIAEEEEEVVPLGMFIKNYFFNPIILVFHYLEVSARYCYC